MPPALSGAARHLGKGAKRAAVRARLTEPLPLVVLLALAAGLLVFFNLVEEVGEGDTHAADRAILLALRAAGAPSDPLGPPWFEEFARDVTGLGSVGVLAFVVLASCGYLRLIGKRSAALFVLVAVGGGMAASFLIKRGFERPRPDLVSHAVETFTSSFPSSHAMMSAVAYLTLGVLLARFQRRRALKAYVLGLAVVLTLAIGASRIYLGVHWPSDVAGGWIAGSAWALGCWYAALVLQDRGRVERNPPGDADAALQPGGASENR